MQWAFPSLAIPVYDSLCAPVDTQILQQQWALESSLDGWAGLSHGSRCCRPGDVTGVWRGGGCVGVGFHHSSPQHPCAVGVCGWRNLFQQTCLAGLSRPKNHVFPTKRSTRWPFRSPAISLGMAIASSPALRPPSSRSLRESRMVAVASSPWPWRLVVVAGRLVRREDEPEHVKSRWSFFGTDVMMFIPPFDLGWGSLQRALTCTLWDWTPSESPGLCGMPTLALNHLCWHSWGMDACMGSLSQLPGPPCWGPLTLATSNGHPWLPSAVWAAPSSRSHTVSQLA